MVKSSARSEGGPIEIRSSSFVLDVIFNRKRIRVIDVRSSVIVRYAGKIDLKV